MTDDELLELLAAALVPEAAEPSPASLVALRRTVLDQQRRVHRRWRRRVALPALAGVMTFAGGGVAFAVSGATLPEPVRAPAHRAGLPVDSPTVAEARAARAELRRGLATGTPTAVSGPASRLRRALEDLHGGERTQVGDADELLRRADDEVNGTNHAQEAERAPTSTTPLVPQQQAPPEAKNGSGDGDESPHPGSTAPPLPPRAPTGPAAPTPTTAPESPTSNTDQGQSNSDGG